MTPSGIEPVTFRLVVQCLNQLCHCVLPNFLKWSDIFCSPKVHTDPEAHAATSSVGADFLLSEVKEAEARGWTTHHCLVTRIECVELLLHSPYVPS